MLNSAYKNVKRSISGSLMFQTEGSVRALDFLTPSPGSLTYPFGERRESEIMFFHP